MQESGKPYDGIAPFYDYIMRHVDYKMWARYIKNILLSHSKKTKTLIDISCGTGSLISYYTKNKIQKFGSDISLSMLHAAQKKKNLSGIPFICTDFRHLPFRTDTFDAVICLYDSVNYLLETEEINSFFEDIAAILKDNGLFIFDVVTPELCAQVFADYREEKFWGLNGYKRRSWYKPETHMQYNRFEVTDNDKTTIELHRQKIRPIEDWKALLYDSPFQVVGILGDFTFRPPKRNAERIHFVCKVLK